MTTLLLLCILAIGYAACWILRLQHHVKIVSNGRSEATRLWFEALFRCANFQSESAKARVESACLRTHLKAREVRIYELWVENNKLKDDLAFYQLRMGHLAGQLCECRHNLSPQIERNN